MLIIWFSCTDFVCLFYSDLRVCFVFFFNCLALFVLFVCFVLVLKLLFGLCDCLFVMLDSV